MAGLYFNESGKLDRDAIIEKPKHTPLFPDESNPPEESNDTTDNRKPHSASREERDQ